MVRPAKQEGAVRLVPVPEVLRGRSEEEIRAWAREMLHGQEASLRSDTIRQIKDGELREVLLKPKRPGFFLPDGTFIEAFDTVVGIGDDLIEAEREMEQEERDWQWVDEENRRFNKRSVPEESRGGPTTLQLWAHGKRVCSYAQERGRGIEMLWRMLAERSDAHGYGVMAHETAVEFFEWRPNAKPDEAVFHWSWQLIDSILKFSSDKVVRDRLASLVADHLLPSGASQQSVTYFLRTENPKRSIWKQDTALLNAIKRKLHKEQLDPGEIRQLIDQFRASRG